MATLIHADVYRTGGLGEVVELALAELVEERAIALVEWGELAAPALGDDALEILLERARSGPRSGAGPGGDVGPRSAPSASPVAVVGPAGPTKWDGPWGLHGRTSTEVRGV